jgi:RecA-family ATPase
MGLRGVKPKALSKRLKMFLYGPAKIGKSTAAIQFPKPYWIDTEACADKKKYVELIEKHDGVVFQTQDFDELLKEVRELLTTKHEYKTLIIDSLTILYNDLVDKAGVKFGTDFGRHYNEANKKVKHLLNLLLRLDMNVIITSHSKNEYGQNMTVLGQTFDCYKKLDYLFDLIIEVQKRGKERVAIIKGSRFEQFSEDEVFPFNYEEIAKRYGKEVIERDSIAEILATEEQVREVKRLIDLLKVPEETYQKWLEKYQSEKFEEMTQEAIQKCLDYLRSKIQGEAA